MFLKKTEGNTNNPIVLFYKFCETFFNVPLEEISGKELLSFKNQLEKIEINGDTEENSKVKKDVERIKKDLEMIIKRFEPLLTLEKPLLFFITKFQEEKTKEEFFAFYKMAMDSIKEKVAFYKYTNDFYTLCEEINKEDLKESQKEQIKDWHQRILENYQHLNFVNKENLLLSLINDGMKMGVQLERMLDKTNGLTFKVNCEEEIALLKELAKNHIDIEEKSTMEKDLEQELNKNALPRILNFAKPPEVASKNSFMGRLYYHNKKNTKKESNEAKRKQLEKLKEKLTNQKEEETIRKVA